MIHGEDKAAYIDGPLDLRSKASIASRGIHLNGWPLKYPYAFRSWKEEDLKRFIYRVGATHQPVSGRSWKSFRFQCPRREAYCRRSNGLWITRRTSAAWKSGSCSRRTGSVSATVASESAVPNLLGDRRMSENMNPADQEQFANILKSFEALYKVVNNADAFCFIDSDPGGWAHSPLSDQTKIFNAARKLLDQYSAKGPKTKLVDWMWLGWGLFDPTEKNARKTRWLSWPTPPQFQREPP